MPPGAPAMPPTQPRFWLLLLLSLASIAVSPAGAAEIVIFGDSWGTGGGQAFLDMLDRYGSTVAVDNVAVGGTTAESWSRTPDALAAAIRANPDCTHVWLTIGGNDGIARLLAGERPIEGVIDTVVDLMRIFVDPAVAEFPHVQIVMWGYDIIDFSGIVCGALGLGILPECVLEPRCMNNGTFALQRMANELSLVHPESVVALDLRGAMQEASGTVAPPYPNLDAFTPPALMADCIHPNYAGYSAVLEASWQRYWFDHIPHELPARARAAAPAAPAAAKWINLTVYHANQANYSAGDIADMNTADALGDLEFTVRSKLLPVECADPRMAHHASYDCANPEQDATNIAITKLILTINASLLPDGESDGYCPCNVHGGVYSCGFGGSANCAGFGSIPVGQFLGRFYNASHYNASSPNYDWWGYNVLQRFGKGSWYSTVGSEECTDAKLAAGESCAWKVAEVVKRVSRNCSDATQEAAVYAADTASGSGGCFTKCAQPLNKTSVCWVDCYYKTLLGAAAGEEVVAKTDGIALAKVVAAWDAAFGSDDPAKGGCPSI